MILMIKLHCMTRSMKLLSGKLKRNRIYFVREKLLVDAGFVHVKPGLFGDGYFNKVGEFFSANAIEVCDDKSFNNILTYNKINHEKEGE